jgi:hypothetical protein
MFFSLLGLVRAPREMGRRERVQQLGCTLLKMKNAPASWAFRPKMH